MATLEMEEAELMAGGRLMGGENGSECEDADAWSVSSHDDNEEEDCDTSDENDENGDDAPPLGDGDVPPAGWEVRDGERGGVDGLDPDLDIPPVVDEEVPDDEDLLDMLDDNFIDDQFDMDEEEEELFPPGNGLARGGDAANGAAGGAANGGMGNGNGNGNGGVDMSANGRGVPAGAAGAGGARRRQRGRNAEVEVHLNIGEILGMRGSFKSVLKYVFWVIMFNLSCMVVGILIPAQIGALCLFLTTGVWAALLGQVMTALDSLSLHTSVDYVGLFMLLFQPTEDVKIIRFSELLIVGVGISSLAVVIIILNGFNVVLKHFYTFDTQAIVPGTWPYFLTVIGALGEILKIGSMLGFRIFCLPCIIGSLVMIFCNTFLQASLQSAFEWAGNNIIGALGVVGMRHCLHVISHYNNPSIERDNIASRLTRKIHKATGISIGSSLFPPNGSSTHTSQAMDSLFWSVLLPLFCIHLHPHSTCCHSLGLSNQDVFLVHCL